MSNMKTNLYNQDGTLSTQAQSLLSPKPDDMSMSERRKLFKEFKSQLSEEDLKEFARLKINSAGRICHQQNKEERNAYSRAYHQQNKEERKAYSRAYYQQNKEERNAASKAYHQQNKEERNAASKAYREKQDKEERKAYMAEYARARRQKDPLYRFFESIRSQAVRVVKQVGLGKKPTNTFKWVGCSPEGLKAHIESLFLEGMTWDNYGKYGWHVDHIRPVSSFKPEEWEQINHYTNLQPLWWQDNLSKSSSY